MGYFNDDSLTVSASAFGGYYSAPFNFGQYDSISISQTVSIDCDKDGDAIAQGQGTTRGGNEFIKAVIASKESYAGPAVTVNVAESAALHSKGVTITIPVRGVDIEFDWGSATAVVTVPSHTVRWKCTKLEMPRWKKRK
jgi:hypothetical protein